ncbi:hypothetical protein [Bosea sp. (in: a-proteobacteria)]|uniref:hypothetical protein n=1 Tax=Bosea sp. (in: a-proteobacteria) TaxID=1871050 RepID=UPI002732D696|nr:hypothetical protein [Bosea sp. (in: a-proteobacteria)]MDP3407250.1 hypothetical protein [Bosea sp. (in: a-proteobacteria)]
MKTIGIEAFLTWAYRDELPKAEAGAQISLVGSLGGEMTGGWDAVSRQGELMAETVRDGRVNSFGVLPLSIDCGPPHPDALVAHAAVSALDRWEIGLPEDWDPLADMHLSEADRRDAVARAMPRIVVGREGVARFRQRPAELVRHHAIMRSAPGWEAQAPVSKFVTGPTGNPAWFRRVTVTEGMTTFEREVDGFNPRTRRPWPGAYKKTYLDPDPAFAAADRAEYEIWHAALAQVAETLETAGLAGHRVLHPARPARPWEGGGDAARPPLTATFALHTP